jgi:hypothetical protein
MMLSTVGLREKYCGQVACMIPRDFWRAIGIGKSTWIKAMRRLRNAGVIDYVPWGGEIEVIIKQQLPCPFQEGRDRDYERAGNG